MAVEGTRCDTTHVPVSWEAARVWTWADDCHRQQPGPGGSHPRTDGSFIDGCRGSIISIMFRRRQHQIKTLLTTHNIGKILFLVPCHGNIKCIIRVGGGAFSTYEGAFQNTRWTVNWPFVRYFIKRKMCTGPATHAEERGESWTLLEASQNWRMYPSHYTRYEPGFSSFWKEECCGSWSGTAETVDLLEPIIAEQPHVQGSQGRRVVVVTLYIRAKILLLQLYKMVKPEGNLSWRLKQFSYP